MVNIACLKYMIGYLILVLIPHGVAEVSNEVVSSTTTVAPEPEVYCYTCMSWKDNLCKDPYDKKTLTPNWCGGSCFKRVIKSAPTGIPKGIERGCSELKTTDNFCESYTATDGSSGTKCVCPSDRCNSVSKLPVPYVGLLIIMATACMMCFSKKV